MTLTAWNRPHSSLVVRKPARSLVPFCTVLLAAVAVELLDMRDDLATFGHWRWLASAHDIANTVFWPGVLVALSRRTRVFR